MPASVYQSLKQHSCLAGGPRTEAPYLIRHRLADAHGSPLWTLGGSYRWELARSGDRWLIDTVVMTAVWGDGNRGLSVRAAGR